jgi:hypothetical protein
MDIALEQLLIVKRTRHATTAASVSTGTTFSADAANPAGTGVIGTAEAKVMRFVEVYASGDVYVETGDSETAAATPGTGSGRVLAGTIRIFPLPKRRGKVPQLKVVSASGSVSVAVVWLS